jgi:hypothetical protein
MVLIFDYIRRERVHFSIPINRRLKGVRTVNRETFNIMVTVSRSCAFNNRSFVIHYWKTIQILRQWLFKIYLRRKTKLKRAVYCVCN